MLNRWIVHLDMDSFYVAVERLKNPRLNGQPMVVGGTSPRSVVASASYEARRFGVHSAMPIAQAQRLCPKLIIVPPSFADYTEISKTIFNEVKKLAPVFEKVSIDEAYLDLTGCEKIYPHRTSFARRLKDLVYASAKLNCSVGMGTNKMIAKIATDEGKPNGLFEVLQGQEETFLARLPIEKIPGIGKKTAALLHAKGILLCADLASQSDLWIRQELGPWGFEWQAKARGHCNSPVVEEWTRQSLSAEETFPQNIGDQKSLEKVLLDLAEEVGFELRRENLLAKTVHIKIRYPDFSTITRCLTLDLETELTGDISRVALELLRKHRDPHQPLRLLGLKLSQLQDKTHFSPQPVQLDLFNEERPLNNGRQIKLEQAKDTLRQRFGKNIFLSHVDRK